MRFHSVRVRAVLMCAVALVLAGCSTSPTEEAMLPIGFAERSDTPYITGSILERTDIGGQVRIRVRASRGTLSRVPEAWVTVAPSALIKWRDGTIATVRYLHVGRRVMVWATGAEMHSAPPQVTGNAFLLTR